jgi:anti-sigma regulatory factor (Ser/Thr protein kinase)
MSPPLGASTLDTHERGALPNGAGSRGRSQELDSDDLVVWGAVSPLAPVIPTDTERRFRFRGLPQAVGAARQVLRSWEGHFEPDLFYDLSLCVSELVTNRVRYGSASAGEEIELVVRRDEELVRVEVREPRAEDIMAAPLAEPLSDWELFIVDRVADRWGVDRGEGTVVWCEIDLASDGWSRNASALRTTSSSLFA